MKLHSQLSSILALLIATIASGGRAIAQATPAAPLATGTSNATTEEVVKLSPFEVTAGRETGYAAATSLAGNRLNTDLRDVGSAITVVTGQMLRDIGAVNNLTLLQYTSNTEVGSIFGNFSNAGSGTQLNESFNNVNTNTRVRGLTSADNTRDYFLTDIPWDAYNTDRIDFQRGPNAILFGLGSPAGVINNGTKTAGFRDKGEIEFRYGSYGSNRTTLDLNHVLIDNELAFRFDALRDRTEYEQQPAYSLDQRIFGTVRYEPAFLNKGSAHTTIKASYEAGKVNSNRPRALTPGDNITPWFRTGTAQGFDSAGNPLTYNNLNKIGFSAIGLQDTNIASTGVSNLGQFVKNYSNGALNPYWQPWLGGQLNAGGYDNPFAVFDSGASTAVHYYVGTPSTVRGLSPSGTIDGSIGGIPFSRESTITIYRDISKKVNLPGAKFGLTRNLQLSDPSIFDFYHNLIDGPNKSEWQNFHAFNVSLAQTVLNGDAGFEAAYDRQHYDQGQLSFIGNDKGQTLNIDVIQTLADGTANPNFGRPFIGDSSANGNNSSSIDRDAFRLTGFLKHDFNQGQNRSWLTKLLGEHTVTGLYSDDTRKADGRSWVRYGTDLSYKDMNSNSVLAIDSSTRVIYPIVYLGGSLAKPTTASGANIPRPTALQVAKTGSIRVYDSTWTATGVNPGDPWTNTYYPVGNSNRNSTQSENPANYRGWTDIPFNVLDSEQGNRDALTNSAQLTKSNVASQAVVWQGRFWDGGLVAMYGYRDDISKAWSKQGVKNNLDQVNLDPSSYFLPSTHIRIHSTSNTYSVVAHLSQLIPNRLPVELSVFYNKSENFQPLAGRVDPYGNALPLPKGNTTDYGIMLATRDGRYSVKVNKYESKVVNASGQGFSAFLLGSIFAEGQDAWNVYTYKLGGYTMDTANQGDPSRYTYQPSTGQTQAQAAAEQAAAVAGWQALFAQMPQSYFNAWGLDFSQIKQHTAVTPIGLAQPEDDTSKGYELEFYAQPIRNLRLTINASKAEAVRFNIGGKSLSDLATLINTALNTTPAGDLRLPNLTGAGTSSATTTLQDWNASFWATYSSFKIQEGAAVPELRKYRANFVANYDFDRGILKGVNVGAGYRWQDRVVIGYTPIYLNGVTPTTNAPAATAVTFDLSKPFYGPSEKNIDLWIGYEHRLNKKLNWRTQVNVRNAFQHDALIPITVQPDGTPATFRIVPAAVWTLTNTLEF
ncbi:MAG: TonB-dependent receptor plug domain-containing protein [Opitutaceae bacterium]|jgi:hypothetical protein